VVAAELRAIKRWPKNGHGYRVRSSHNGLMSVQHIMRASVEFLVLSLKGFHVLANGHHGIGIPALTHLVYCTFSATYSTRLLQK
jgi:hypothetical protein